MFIYIFLFAPHILTIRLFSLFSLSLSLSLPHPPPFLSFLGVRDALAMPLATVREKMVANLCVGVLACYRKNCTSANTAAGQV